MANSYFVTGTDRGLGTTTVTLSLMAAVAQRGLSVMAMKPIALDSHQTASGLRNDDAIRLQQMATSPMAYDLVNPYPLTGSLPVALSAMKQGVEIDVGHIKEKYQQLTAKSAMCFVEGCRGWHEPLNRTQTYANLVQALDIPVIMVVSITSSAPNMAVLTYQQILKSGVCPAGWVANIVSTDEPATPRIIELIQQHIYTPLVGIIPPMKVVSETRVADFLDLDFLLGFEGCRGKETKK